MIETVPQGTHKSVQVAISPNNSGAASAQVIADQLGNKDFAFVLVFFSPSPSADEFCTALQKRLPTTLIYGCSTAGELTPEGFTDGAIVALGFLSEDFHAEAILIPQLDEFTIGKGQFNVREAVRRFQMSRSPSRSHCFALMLVDGLCYREEQLVSAVNYGLRDVPLIGGSAGDGMSFEETFVIHEGQLHKNAAILLLIESRFPLHIFKCDSFTPTDLKFVVTKADPEKRLVYELNALPAATAYANALGLQPNELDPFCFASHPLSVCFGGDCYVRSIQDVYPDGAFRFYCAIDEGIVFTLSEIGDMVDSINQTIETIHDTIGEPQLILGFDCVLRRMMAEINQSKGQVNQIFKEHGIVGFNTYGEQVHAMHLNLTFSGIAIGQ